MKLIIVIGTNTNKIIDIALLIFSLIAFISPITNKLLNYVNKIVHKFVTKKAVTKLCNA